MIKGEYEMLGNMIFKNNDVIQFNNREKALVLSYDKIENSKWYQESFNDFISYGTKESDNDNWYAILFDDFTIKNIFKINPYQIGYKFNGDYSIAKCYRLKNQFDVADCLLNKRELKTKNVRVKDGDTLILGGLIQETESVTHKKFPVLADLPVIGAFFQDQGTTKERSELILMITPRILKDVDQAESI